MCDSCESHLSPEILSLKKLTGEVLDELNYPFMRRLEKKGLITLKELYIDGTKIKANANRYIFVSRDSLHFGDIKECQELKTVLTDSSFCMLTVADRNRTGIQWHKKNTQKGVVDTRKLQAIRLVVSHGINAVIYLLRFLPFGI